MLLELVCVPDKRLQQKSKPVEEINPELLEFMNDMLETMYENSGVGLAAIQVGTPKRVMVVDVRDKEIETEDEEKKRNPRFLINPEIIWKSDECTDLEEGCLSVPGQRAVVKRPKKIKVKYLDEKNKERILEADDLLSKCIQHEIDHMNGKLFVDYLSKLKRDVLVNKAKKFKKQED